MPRGRRQKPGSGSPAPSDFFPVVSAMNAQPKYARRRNDGAGIPRPRDYAQRFMIELLLAGQARRASAGRATILAVTHVVAGAAHAIDCVVLAEPRSGDADSTGLALRADPGPTSLLFPTRQNSYRRGAG